MFLILVTVLCCLKLKMLMLKRRASVRRMLWLSHCRCRHGEAMCSSSTWFHSTCWLLWSLDASRTESTSLTPLWVCTGSVILCLCQSSCGFDCLCYGPSLLVCLSASSLSVCANLSYYFCHSFCLCHTCICLFDCRCWSVCLTVPVCLTLCQSLPI